MGSASNAEEALTSLKDFHAQYNRLEGVLKFKVPKVSSKLMMNGGRGQNEKLDEIYNRLRDPNGNAERLRRNAIVNNKHRAGLVPWHAPGTLNNVSLSNISDGVSHAFMPGALQSTRHRRHNTSFFSSLDQPFDSGHPIEPSRGRAAEGHASVPFQGTRTLRDSSRPTGGPWLSGAESQRQSHMAMLPFRTLSTTRAAGSTASGAAFGRSGHPFEAKLAELRDHHRRHTTQDHEAAYYAKKLNQEAQLEEGRGPERPPKMSDWIAKEVMLPILGKNKTSLLHSPDQFEIDSISQ